MSKKKNKTAKAFAAKREHSPAGAPRTDKEETTNTRKIRLLYHGDSPKVNTGFGVVAREILSRLQKTGKYEIHSCGINDKGDPNRYSGLSDMHHYALPDYVNDPYGAHKLPDIMKGIKPDVIFTLNDIWILDGSERNGTKDWFLAALKRFCPNVPWVFYFPVDSRPWTLEWADLAFSADKTIVYSKYAEKVLKELHPELDPIYINHGVSLTRFNVIDQGDRVRLRAEMGVEEDNFLLGFVSRNQPRKNPAAIIEIFKMANEGYRKCQTCDAIRNLDDPECEYCGESNEVSVEFPSVLEGKGKCYLHFNFQDSMGIDAAKVINDNKAHKGIIHNPGHSIPFGLPEEQFNAIFNCLDCHLLTTTAEGFGLTVLEGMACGVPTMATRTTAVTELLEQGGGIPIIPQNHFVFDDAANTRKHIIHYERAILALGELYEDWKNRQDQRWGPKTKARVDMGLAFAEDFTWDKAAEEFDHHICDAIDSRVKLIDQFTEKEGVKFLFQKAGDSGDVLQTMPAIRRLREKYPDAEFCYALPSNLMPMFENKCPWVDSIIPMDKMNDKNPEEKKIRVTILNFSGPEEPSRCEPNWALGTE
jgi:glycosyltransferase involved in cell wall biosynthesis